MKNHEAGLLLAMILLIVCQNDGHAYIDPGSGNMILQLLLAVVVGSVAAIRIFWTYIKTYLFFWQKKK